MQVANFMIRDQRSKDLVLFVKDVRAIVKGESVETCIVTTD